MRSVGIELTTGGNPPKARTLPTSPSRGTAPGVRTSLISPSRGTAPGGCWGVGEVVAGVGAGADSAAVTRDVDPGEQAPASRNTVTTAAPAAVLASRTSAAPVVTPAQCRPILPVLVPDR
ncbi:hypothetical protein GCM10012278_78950 [Nonomuraea glycinis]|uniref:Uncharacterized protein n=1 Tax=Nonomuraea glycinis TaxID=2047744 RepID=A0A918AGL7_9ACTN|nr:hypothetical protein GCM10012278_78950 [Nonomuraea glycinis]